MLETEKLYIDNKQLYYRVAIKMDLLKIMRIHQQLATGCFFCSLGQFGSGSQGAHKISGG